MNEILTPTVTNLSYFRENLVLARVDRCIFYCDMNAFAKWSNINGPYRNLKRVLRMREHFPSRMGQWRMRMMKHGTGDNDVLR